MSWIMVFSAILVGLLLSGLYSGCETGLYCVNRLRVELGVRSGEPGAVRLQSLLQDEQGSLSVALIGTNVANYMTTSAVAYLFASMLNVPDGRAEIYTVALLTPFVFVFGEVVPKNIFQLHADHLMKAVSVPLSVTARICRMTGAVYVLGLFVKAANRLAGALHSDTIATPRRRVALLIQDALADREMGPEQSELVDRVVQLSETPVHAVMVPRNQVTSIRRSADRHELMRVGRRTGHARLPVYETARTHVVGIVKVDELLRRDDWRSVGECLSAVPVIRPHITVAQAIRTLQELRRSLAIVTDQGGRMLGIVTLTDLLEELVG